MAKGGTNSGIGLRVAVALTGSRVPLIWDLSEERHLNLGTIAPQISSSPKE